MPGGFRQYERTWTRFQLTRTWQETYENHNLTITTLTLRVPIKFSVLSDEADLHINDAIDKLTEIVIETSMEVGGKAPRTPVATVERNEGFRKVEIACGTKDRK